VNGRVESERLSFAEEAARRRLYQLIEEGRVETIHSQEASLEEIFVTVTGRGLS
jgi:fluoroquinolone transport system ATP-binding protein